MQYQDLNGHWHGGTPAFSALDNPYNGAAYSGSVAALNGEANPTAITYVATSRAKAANLTGGAVDSDQAAYMVQVKGQLNGAAAHHPRGLPAPHGTVLTVVIDAVTLQVTDWGLTNTTAPLNQLGRVQAVS
ncbi:MAG: hypothetical protein M3Z75_18970 [Actinomycetota bacterium]|nr:hypothetical protein [Actinomycetota bacterium]